MITKATVGSLSLSQRSYLIYVYTYMNILDLSLFIVMDPLITNNSSSGLHLLLLGIVLLINSTVLMILVVFAFR